MNIVYNPAIVQLVAAPNGCVPQSGSVCNPAFAANTIRVTGAAASGLVGNTTLASLTFLCGSVGTSALTVTVDTLADATPGAPRDIVAATSNGSVSCVTAPTPQPTTQPVAGGGAGAETGAQCANSIDDDGDGVINDGCAASGAAETGAHCSNNTDDDGDGAVNDGCPAVQAAAAANGGPNAGFGPGGTGPSVLIWLVAGLAGAGLAWLSAGLAGAGLAAVTGSGAGRRPGRSAGFLPRLRPLAQRKQRAAEPKPAAADHTPSFRVRERSGRDR
jgi:hypothetical protein